MEVTRNKDGTIKPGTVLNKKGRPKGSKNLNTSELRALVNEFVSSELENTSELLVKLSPKDRLDVLIRLMNFVLPKKFETSEKEEKVMTITWNDPKPIDYSKLTDEELHAIIKMDERISENKKIN